jgi:hypothetical protein
MLMAICPVFNEFLCGIILLLVRIADPRVWQSHRESRSAKIEMKEVRLGSHSTAFPINDDDATYPHRSRVVNISE